MNIEELEYSHYINVDKADINNTFQKEDLEYLAKEHTKLSIEFAISVLEDDLSKYTYRELPEAIKDKIQELKTYLNEENS